MLELDRLGLPRRPENLAEQGNQHADRQFRVLAALHDPPVADLIGEPRERPLPAQGDRGVFLQGGKEPAERGQRGRQGRRGQRDRAHIAEGGGGAGEAEAQAEAVEPGLPRRLLEQVAIGGERQAVVRLCEGLGGEAGGGEHAPGRCAVRGDELRDAGRGHGDDAGQVRLASRRRSGCHATPPFARWQDRSDDREA